MDTDVKMFYLKLLSINKRDSLLIFFCETGQNVTSVRKVTAHKRVKRVCNNLELALHLFTSIKCQRLFEKRILFFFFWSGDFR